MSKTYKLWFPEGEKEMHLTKGLPENPKQIDPQHDTVIFCDTVNKKFVVIDEDLAKMLEPHLSPRVKMEPIEDVPEKPKNGKKNGNKPE